MGSIPNKKKKNGQNDVFNFVEFAQSVGNCPIFSDS